MATPYRIEIKVLRSKDCRYNERLRASRRISRDQTHMAENHPEEHSSPIKTPGQLIAVVVASFVVPIVLISIVAHIVTGGTSKDNPALSDEAIAKRLKPVGELVVDPNQPAPVATAPV